MKRYQIGITGPTMGFPLRDRPSNRWRVTGLAPEAAARAAPVSGPTAKRLLITRF